MTISDDYEEKKLEDGESERRRIGKRGEMGERKKNIEDYVR